MLRAPGVEGVEMGGGGENLAKVVLSSPISDLNDTLHTLLEAEQVLIVIHFSQFNLSYSLIALGLMLWGNFMTCWQKDAGLILSGIISIKLFESDS